MNELMIRKNHPSINYAFDNIFSETSIIGFNLNLNEWQHLNQWTNEIYKWNNNK